MDNEYPDFGGDEVRDDKLTCKCGALTLSKERWAEANGLGIVDELSIHFLDAECSLIVGMVGDSGEVVSGNKLIEALQELAEDLRQAGHDVSLP